MYVPTSWFGSTPGIPSVTISFLSRTRNFRKAVSWQMTLSTEDLQTGNLGEGIQELCLHLLEYQL